MSGLLYRAWLASRHPRVYRALGDGERFQYLSSDEIRHRQWTLLTGMLRHAYTASAFYRAWIGSAGAAPDDIRSPEDYARLPVMTKSLLRERYDEMRIPGEEGVQKNHTGGSTGHPVTLYQDAAYRACNDAYTLRFDRWAGWDFGARTAVVWGAERDLVEYQSRWAVRFVSERIRREYYLNAFTLDDDTLARFLDAMRSVRPHIVRGYVSALTHLARRASSEIARWPFRVRGVIAAAETLTDEQRASIESAFGARVFNRYGSRDAGMIAAECEEHDGLHVAADNVFVETVPVDGLPQDREILVTTLRNRAMPLFRYAIGDLAREAGTSACRCGRGLPRLAAVTGRTSDMIVLPEGRAVHGEYFTHLFYGVAGVRQFQVVQRSVSALSIQVVTDPSFDPAVIDRIRHEVRTFLRTGIRIDVEQVDDIPAGPTGKRRFTISHVAGGNA